MSDPVLEVLHDNAESGVVPDDLDARGKLSDHRSIGAHIGEAPFKGL
ncbi:hypothetical protein [Ruegeria hyattellae]